jgi:hypothetical protein
VIISISDGGEGLRAHLTGIRLLSCVLSLVDSKVSFLGIFFPATKISANELFLLTRVGDFNMVVEVLLVCVEL